MLKTCCKISWFCAFYVQDCEAIWNNRDDGVRQLCAELGIEVVEKISHTLWDPFKIIDANGGQPPLTYEMFLVRSKLLCGAGLCTELPR